MKKTILFICTHNSARSQMAEGLVNGFFNDGYKAFSAGTAAAGVNLYAIRAMAELGIDISGHYSKSVEEFKNKKFDYVVTVCDSAKESCPFFPGKNIAHRSFRDPAAVNGSDEEKLEAFRNVRDEISRWLKEEFMKPN
jgi:arsenate reductase